MDKIVKMLSEKMGTNGKEIIPLIICVLNGLLKKNKSEKISIRFKEVNLKRFRKIRECRQNHQEGSRAPNNFVVYENLNHRFIVDIWPRKILIYYCNDDKPLEPS